MAISTDPPEQGFRLSQLIYDTRYRSMTIQVVAFILIMSGLLYLGNNVAQNYPGGFDFGFLGERAGYDINQRLIEYDNNRTHARAALVGMLNTLLVAFLGCIVATIFGVFMGVLRLSKNWVVARLAAIYVEIFRNVPLLLWIIVIFAIITESLPAPRDFRGDDASATMIAGDSIALTNRGFYVPNVVFANSLSGNEVDPETQQVIASATPMDWALVVLVLILGVIGARMINNWATKTQNQTGIRPKGVFWMRAGAIVIPVTLVLEFLGAQWQLPELRGFNFADGIHLRNTLLALWLALALYTGAFIAEIVRAGILSVSRGQTEASFALGLRPSWTMNLIILPQALRVIIPPLISQFLNLTKNSSLALAVGYMDIRATLGGITLSQTGRELESILLLGLCYLITSLIISAAMNVYNSSVKLKER